MRVKTESTIRPTDKFRIDKKGNLCEVTFFDDIQEITRETEDGNKEILYTYYEYKTEILDRDNLKEQINANIDGWLESLKNIDLEETKAEVRAKRDKLLKESDKEMVIDRLNITLPTGITASTLLSAIKDVFSNLNNVLNGEWAKYRQELRDITIQDGFPYDIEFPKKPEV